MLSPDQRAGTSPIPPNVRLYFKVYTACSVTYLIINIQVLPSSVCQIGGSPTPITAPHNVRILYGNQHTIYTLYPARHLLVLMVYLRAKKVSTFQTQYESYVA